MGIEIVKVSRSSLTEFLELAIEGFAVYLQDFRGFAFMPLMEMQDAGPE